MLFSPFVFTEAKVVCIVSLLFFMIVKFVFYSQDIKISKSILVWLSLFMLHGLIFLFIGLFHGAQTAYVLKFATIVVIWPLVFSLFFFYKLDQKYVITLFKVIEISVVFISLYAIYRVVSLFGFLPVYDMYAGETPGISLSEGNIEISLPATTSLMFAVPSLVSLYLLTKEKRLIPVISLSIIAIVFISRRALLLNVLITPFICLAISVFFLEKKYVRSLFKSIYSMYIVAIIFCLFIFIGLSYFGIFDFIEFFNMIIEGFDFSGQNSVDPGAQIRAEQFTLLIKSWSEKPFLGWGYGSVSQYIIRSDQTPFIYELSYIALLFQTGILGFLSYISFIFWIYYKFCKLRKVVSLMENYYNISILVGLTTFLLANATNPYLYAFDHMWTLFFPLLIINSIILKKHKHVLEIH